MTRLPQHLLAALAWVVIGPLCGAAGFAIIFESPVWIFQEPENSMLGWGYVTTIPALLVGVFCAGVSSRFILKRRGLVGSKLHPMAIGAIQFGAACGVVGLLGEFGL